MGSSSGNHRSIIELLGEPAGIEEVDFEPPSNRDEAVPATFDSGKTEAPPGDA